MLEIEDNLLYQEAIKRFKEVQKNGGEEAIDAVDNFGKALETIASNCKHDYKYATATWQRCVGCGNMKSIDVL